MKIGIMLGPLDPSAWERFAEQVLCHFGGSGPPTPS
jgi:hypothetical protein